MATNNQSVASSDVKVDKTCSLPEAFPFPFQPYSIQEDFMKNLYTALDAGKIGIFESPTGTGKSLSLICGALTWLRDYEEKQRQEVEAILEAQNDQQQQSASGNKSTGSSVATPDWVLEFDEKKAAKERALKMKDEQDQILKREAKLEEIRNNLKQKQFKRKV
ncbi:ATP-dependent DNA helicase DDX11-like [Amphiura filiformis]|uniref:ATP-dependent DNA helicase DDX11-like n=1 Tax=Amphiura filiformis TaxID=82378 RepID=UPI003B21559C